MFTLETLCLDLIAQEFERFHFARSVSKDAKLQRNFEFLRKEYSVKLVTALYISENLKDDYFDDLLINEYLHSLISNWFQGSSYLTSMDSIICRLPNLTRLCFRECNDEILLYVANFCPKIAEIDVRNSDVSDDGVKYLCNLKHGMVPCPNIRKLFIKETLVSDTGAECLIRNLPLLEWIDYYKTGLLLYYIYNENLSELENLQGCNLNELDLLCCLNEHNYTDILELCLNVCTKLNSIACYISEQKQLGFLVNSRLKKLYLRLSKDCPRIDIDDLLKTNGYYLTSLKIGAYSVLKNASSLSISALSVYCPVLQEIYVHDVNFTDDEDDNVQISFPCLVKCCISHVVCTKAVGLLLTSSPKLESVSFRYLELEPEMESTILEWCKNHSAKIIDFEYVALKMKFLEDILLNCFSLKAVFLNECEFDMQDPMDHVCILIKDVPKIPKIYFKEITDISNTEGYFVMINMMSASLFLDNDYHLESNLKEEYKSSAVYESLFYETVFNWSFDVPDHEWEKNWKSVFSL